MKFIDRTGEKYGELTVIRKSERRDRGRVWWLCECSCGNQHEVISTHWGRIKSCGCIVEEASRAAHTTHGHTTKRVISGEYRIWLNIIQRTTNPKNPRWSSYGGRGITVCDRWREFENFFADMGKRPSSKHSVERINNDKGYSPENCKWATNIEQCNNQRKTKFFTHNGKTQTLRQWATELGVPYMTLFNRINRYGWSLERALK